MEHRVVISKVYDIFEEYMSKIQKLEKELKEKNEEIKKYREILDVNMEKKVEIKESGEKNIVITEESKKGRPKVVLTDEEKIAKKKESQKRYREKVKNNS